MTVTVHGDPAPAPMAGWDEYQRLAPHGSARWAASDRGWLFRPADRRPNGDPERGAYDVWDGEGRAYRVTVGHYLDYGPGRIHAVRCDPRSATAARMFDSLADARAWVEMAGLPMFDGTV